MIGHAYQPFDGGPIDPPDTYTAAFDETDVKNLAYDEYAKSRLPTTLDAVGRMFDEFYDALAYEYREAGLDAPGKSELVTDFRDRFDEDLRIGLEARA